MREAKEFNGRMPVEPKPNSCAALLSGCCTYNTEETGERAAKKLLELGKGSSSAGYVLLSNLYASIGAWEKVAKFRKLMRELGMKRGEGAVDFCSILGSWDADHSVPKDLWYFGALDIRD